MVNSCYVALGPLVGPRAHAVHYPACEEFDMGEGRSNPDDEDARRRKYRGRTRDRRWAAGLVGAGAVVGLQHWFEHLGVIELPLDRALQDLTVGYPAAALLIVIGLMKIPA